MFNYSPSSATLIALTIFATLYTTASQADKLQPSSPPPASFVNECGSCHLAYPPGLLIASDWQKIMQNLPKHFGSDASLPAATQNEISNFLQNNAGKASRVGNAGDPPRITRSTRFLRKHDEVPKRFWQDPRVKSAANCEACHRDAAKGNFNEHDILIPELRGR